MKVQSKSIAPIKMSNFRSRKNETYFINGVSEYLTGSVHVDQIVSQSGTPGKLYTGNVKIEEHGAENLPKENGFMFFPNHQGMYDVLAILDACPYPFSVVAKKEVKDVPFLKQVFSCMHAYMIDREDIRQSMQVIIDVSKEVQNGKNYLIFAEGTRSKNGNQIGSFKGGSFKAATKAKCPIVPVALIDSFKPFDTKTISQVTVQVHFLEPLYYEEYKNMKTTEIAEIVHDRIQKIIDENCPERAEIQ